MIVSAVAFSILAEIPSGPFAFVVSRFDNSVELSKLDQSQATLLQSIIQIQCKEDDIVKTSCQGSAILQFLETIQNKIEQDEWKLLGKELQMVITCPCMWKGKIALSQVYIYGEIFMCVASESC